MSGISKLYINQKLAIHRFENGNELSEYLDPMKLYGRHCEAKPSTKKVVREAIGIEPLSVTAPRIGRALRNSMLDARGTGLFMHGTNAVDWRYQDLLTAGTDRIY